MLIIWSLKAHGANNSYVYSVQGEWQHTYLWAAGGGAQHTRGPPANRFGLRKIHYQKISSAFVVNHDQ